ncbi:uncharacterized protein LOC135330406 isoform X2 [Dromaius novaehollandiae]|uniref:uncharacterized protein LOC135330406 isoform X2 n=1 Tax=Dromaius novaehollandiae TaxID=8790 RepID=UPI00311D3323
MPEMRDSVLSGTETVASQIRSGSVIVFPQYELQIVQPAIKGPAELTEEQEEEKDDNGNKKGALPDNRLLSRERHAPPKKTSIHKEEDKMHKTRGKGLPDSPPPPIQWSSVKKVEAKKKEIPRAGPKLVNFIAEAIKTKEQRRILQVKKRHQRGLCELQAVERQEKKEWQKKEKDRRKEKEKLAPPIPGRGKDNLQRATKPTVSWGTTQIPSASMRRKVTSPDLIEGMMGNWKEDGESSSEKEGDNSLEIPPKRPISPGTSQALLEIVTCILGQVDRSRRGHRHEERDREDKLQCELAVLKWRMCRKKKSQGNDTPVAGPQPAQTICDSPERAGQEFYSLPVRKDQSKHWEALRKKYLKTARTRSPSSTARREREHVWKAQKPTVSWGTTQIPSASMRRKVTSPDLIEGMMGNWKEDGESSSEKEGDNSLEIPPKRHISPRKTQALLAAVTSLVEKVTQGQTREISRQRDHEEEAQG